MELPFLNDSMDSVGLPNFQKGCNFAAAGSTTLPATAASISQFSFGIRVSQFLLFEARVLELLAGISVYTTRFLLVAWLAVAKYGTDAPKLDELGCVNSHNQAAKTFNLQLQAFCSKLQGQYRDANVTYVDILTIKSNLLANYSEYGFEQPIMACWGYGGPPLNYNNKVSCGQTKSLNGTIVTAKGCNDNTVYVNCDGIHYTEAANQYVASRILTGNYSEPPFSNKMPFLPSLAQVLNPKFQLC